MQTTKIVTTVSHVPNEPQGVCGQWRSTGCTKPDVVSDSTPPARWRALTTPLRLNLLQLICIYEDIVARNSVLVNPIYQAEFRKSCCNTAKIVLTPPQPYQQRHGIICTVSSSPQRIPFSRYRVRLFFFSPERSYRGFLWVLVLFLLFF